MPARSTVSKWLADDPAFSDLYARACEARTEGLVDDLLDLADDQSIPADQKRIMVDARKWIACKLVPRKYGDKVDLNHQGGVTLNVVTGVPDADADG